MSVCGYACVLSGSYRDNVFAELSRFFFCLYCCSFVVDAVISIPKRRTFVQRTSARDSVTTARECSARFEVLISFNLIVYMFMSMLLPVVWCILADVPVYCLSTYVHT